MKERPILFSGPMVRALLDGTKTQTRRVCKPAQFYSLSAVVEVPDPAERGQVYNGSHFGDEDGEVQFACPYGGRGDRLWVRETFTEGWPLRNDGIVDQFDEDGNQKPKGFYYRATNPDLEWCDGGDDCSIPVPWRPSIHMPRTASRINLEVTGVRVERLQALSEADSIAEGITFTDYGQRCLHTGRGWTEVGNCPAPPHTHQQLPGWGVEPAGHEQCMHSAQGAYSSLWEQINGPGSWAANPWVWVVEFKRL